MNKYIRWLASGASSSTAANNPITLNGQSLAKTATLTEESGSKPEKVVYVDDPNMWIINDGLLRDEGVLFGLSGVDVTDKVASINSYFEQQRASHHVAKQLAEEKGKENQEALNVVLTSIAEKEQFLQQKKRQPLEFSTGKIIRYLLGLLLVGVAAYGSFFLLHYYITPLYGLAATIGIYLFGQFAQMVPVSSWLQPNPEATASSKTTVYKEALLEIGPSVAATLLAAFLIYKQSGEAGLAFMIGVFLLFLFFFNGKLILGLSQTLVHECKQLQKAKRQRKDHRKEENRLEEEIKTLREKEAKLTASIQESEKQEAEAAIKLEELNEQRTIKVKLFLSEYQLANHFSTTLNLTGNE